MKESFLLYNDTRETVIDTHLQTKKTYTRKISDADIALFALVTGDQHPLHLDDDFAVQTKYAQRIVPISLIVGMVEAGLSHETESSVNLVQIETCTSKAPVYLNDELLITYDMSSEISELGQKCHIVVQRCNAEVILECDAVLTHDLDNFHLHVNS